MSYIHDMPKLKLAELFTFINFVTIYANPRALVDIDNNCRLLIIKTVSLAHYFPKISSIASRDRAS